MQTAKTIEEVRQIIRAQKKAQKTIGFVPAMGALHEGHLSLIKIAREKCDFVVMSIFINKIQFNNQNDFKNYPRLYEKDLELAGKHGTDLVFLPDDEIMYNDQLTYINLEQITDNLCGAFREGHFRGVLTVVAKLFNIVNPDIAVFGQKDIQQVISIKKMVFDLNFPLKIVIAPIIRESDGLAMSSRNIHLSEQERTHALILNRCLKLAANLIKNEEVNVEILLSALNTFISNENNITKFEYISFVNYNNLQPIQKLAKKNILAIAAYAGETRLIDNMIIKTGQIIKCIY